MRVLSRRQELHTSPAFFLRVWTFPLNRIVHELRDRLHHALRALAKQHRHVVAGNFDVAAVLQSLYRFLGLFIGQDGRRAGETEWAQSVQQNCRLLDLVMC